MSQFPGQPQQPWQQPMQQPYQQPMQQQMPPQGYPQQQQYQQPMQQPAYQPQAMPMQQNPFQPPPNAAAVFAGVSNAVQMKDGNYIRPGRNLLLIEAAKINTSRKQEVAFLLECTVVHVIDNDGGRGHALGEKVTHYIPRKSDYFLPEVRGIVSAIFGMPFEQVTEVHCTTICDPTQPLRGMIIDVSARQITTKAGKPFTKVTHHGEIKPAQALQVLSPDIVAKFFPNGILQRLAGQEGQPTAFGAQQHTGYPPGYVPPQQQYGQPMPQGQPMNPQQPNTGYGMPSATMPPQQMPPGQPPQQQPPQPR